MYSSNLGFVLFIYMKMEMEALSEFVYRTKI